MHLYFKDELNHSLRYLFFCILRCITNRLSELKKESHISNSVDLLIYANVSEHQEYFQLKKSIDSLNNHRF